MYIDARNLPDQTLIEGDLCIVGAGPAGLSIAMDWNNTPYKVILLEGGGFEYEDQVQDLFIGTNTGQPYYPIRSTALHYFGGSSGHWGGFCSPFDEIDFEKRAWVPHSGWPIRKADLDPFYANAHEVIGLGPYNYDPAYWQKKDPTLRSLLPDNPVVRNKVWQFSSPPVHFGEKFRPAVEQSPNIWLYTYANVTDITANENVSAVESVTVRNFAGKRHTVKAKRFVLACNGLQNPRILLASNKQAPNGLGNDNDLVGRYFLEHLEIRSAWLHLPTPDPLPFYMREWGNTKMRCELAISPEAQERHAILHGTSWLTPYNGVNEKVPVIKAWNDPDPRKSSDNLAHSYPYVRKSESSVDRFLMSTRLEQAPNPNSRVTLDKAIDAFGMPLIRVHWELSAQERRSIRTMYELIGCQVGAAGVGRVELMDYLEDPDEASWPDFTGGGWHLMGTTRMSDDPHTGVVDADCKVHGIANLFIAGSSIYTTAGAPNPTLTVVALSLRLSDHLKKTAVAMKTPLASK
jgi:choline dehydrogenase-like flavoprotein